MSSLDLYDYQLALLDQLRQGFAAGHRAQMLYCATGETDGIRVIRRNPARTDNRRTDKHNNGQPRHSQRAFAYLVEEIRPCMAP